MLTLETTSHFRGGYKRLKRQGCDMNLLREVLDKLLAGVPLEPRLRDHALKGRFLNYRECHIQPDWLLIYRVDGERLVLVTQRTGTHAELFDL